MVTEADSCGMWSEICGTGKQNETQRRRKRGNQYINFFISREERITLL
jgi:hypothetical protein